MFFKALNIFLIFTLIVVNISCSHIDKTDRSPSSSEEEVNALPMQVRRYRQQCLQINKYMLEKDFEIKCAYNYSHYNSKAYKDFYSKTDAIDAKQVKIASFNLLHPGMRKTKFKDFQIVAKIINKWDLVAALELLPVIGKDLAHNNALVSFISRGDTLINKQEGKIDKLKAKRQTSSVKRQLSAAQEKLAILKSDLKEAPDLYRLPGYLHILQKLRKLDKSWALLLSPRAEAAKETDVKEFVGYFYRAKIVRPFINQYCRANKTYFQGSPFACLPNFSRAFLGKDARDVFSRRPFMANFESGKFDFTLLATHVVFNSPLDPELRSNLLNKSFAATSYSRLGIGINKSNYARFAETKVILEFIDRLRQEYGEKDVILAGDFNLEIKNRFWSSLLKDFPDKEILVDEPTTVSLQRFGQKAQQTFGFVSNYDHFLVDRKSLRECRNFNDEFFAHRFNWYTDDIAQDVIDKYFIIKDVGQTGRVAVARKMKAAAKEYRAKYIEQKTVKRNVLVLDNAGLDAELKELEQRVFRSQEDKMTYFKVFKEVLSDHVPIYMNCRTNIKDDDRRI
ncbi:MAG: hypothetical protein ISR65_05470 [Bacteriovoracaceae bacterium]|nr:hypothetical protein [Bacteriovoracaceae bacterium]